MIYKEIVYILERGFYYIKYNIIIVNYIYIFLWKNKFKKKINEYIIGIKFICGKVFFKLS